MAVPKRPIYSTTEVARIHAELKRRFQAAGRGSIQRIESELGLMRDYFAHHRRGHKLDLGVLIAAVRALGDNPVEFFATALLDDDDSEHGAKMTKSAEKHSGGGSSSGPEQAGRGSVPPAKCEVPIGLASWLDEMDELRYDDPDTALRELRSRVDEVPESAAVRYLAVCGSTHRLIGALTDARACLKAATGWLNPGDDTERAGLLQRWSYVIGDGGDYGEALRFVERAAGIYARLGDEAAMGKALVDQGRLLHYLGRTDAAIGAERLALDKLPDSLPRSLLAAHQILAYLTLEKDAEDSFRHYREAEKLCTSRRERAALLWAESRSLELLERLEAASSKLREVRELLGLSYPLDSVLATAEHVRLLVLLRRPRQAIEVARSATRYIGLLVVAGRNNKVAEAAIADLCRSVTSVGANVRMIDSVIEKLAELQRISKGDGLGDRVVRARAYRGITASQAAKELDMASSTLCAIETGRMPGRIYASRIAAWLRLSASELERFDQGSQ